MKSKVSKKSLTDSCHSDSTNLTLTKEQLQFLDKERELYLNDKVIAYTKDEAITFIKTGESQSTKIQ